MKDPVVAWLESPAGERWSRDEHWKSEGCFKHGLVSIKEDAYPYEGPAESQRPVYRNRAILLQDGEIALQ
jgi:hypothetical protein